MAILLVSGGGGVSAHTIVIPENNNPGIHWNKGGSTVSVYYSMVGAAATSGPAKAAISDINHRNQPVRLTKTTDPTELTLYQKDYGDVGWAGVAGMAFYVPSGHLAHVDVQINTFYSMNASRKQQVWCQELGHAIGLQHANTGDCMDGGYFTANSSIFLGKNDDTAGASHPATDLRNLYSTHPIS